MLQRCDEGVYSDRTVSIGLKPGSSRGGGCPVSAGAWPWRVPCAHSGVCDGRRTSDLSTCPVSERSYSGGKEVRQVGHASPHCSPHCQSLRFPPYVTTGARAASRVKAIALASGPRPPQIHARHVPIRLRCGRRGQHDNHKAGRRAHRQSRCLPKKVDSRITRVQLRVQLHACTALQNRPRRP